MLCANPRDVVKFVKSWGCLVLFVAVSQVLVMGLRAESLTTTEADVSNQANQSNQTNTNSDSTAATEESSAQEAIKDVPLEAPQVLFAVGGDWEMKPADPSQKEEMSSLKPIVTYEHPTSGAKVSIYEMKNKFAKLELSIFQFETLHLDSCFFLENYPLSMGAMDLSIATNERHRMLPVCWNGNKWQWSLFEFLESEENQIFVARYQSDHIPNYKEFEVARNLFSYKLGLCRPSEVQSCFERIRDTSVKIQNRGEALSDNHPRFFNVIRSRAASVSESPRAGSSRFVFKEHKFDSCQNLDEAGDLLSRIQKVAFFEIPQSADRECGFMVSNEHPQYVCQPTKDGGLRTQYTFYPTMEECEKSRETSLQALSGEVPAPQQAAAVHSSEEASPSDGLN